jgi:hypothetical protein
VIWKVKKMSKLLEAVFDEVEFRLAKRAIKRRGIKPQRVAIVEQSDDRISSRPLVKNRIVSPAKVGEGAGVSTQNMARANTRLNLAKGSIDSFA